MSAGCSYKAMCERRKAQERKLIAKGINPRSLKFMALMARVR